MFSLTVLIPVRDNAGIPFQPEAYAAFERVCLELFGGFTRLPAIATGGWLAAGVAYSDDHRIYVLAMQSITQGGRVAQLVAFAKVQFRQETIFVAYLGQTEILPPEGG